MKVVSCLVGLFAFLSTSAFGVRTLCEVSTSGGFGGPAMQAHGIRVNEEGKLYVFDKNPGGTNREVEALGEREFKALKNHVKHTTGTALQPVTLGGCMDAPTTFYRCRIGSGASLRVIARIAMCGLSRLPDPDAGYVQYKLDELRARVVIGDNDRSIRSFIPAEPTDDGE